MTRLTKPSSTFSKRLLDHPGVRVLAATRCLHFIAALWEARQTCRGRRSCADAPRCPRQDNQGTANMKDHEARRRIIREWMALPNAKRHTAVQVVDSPKRRSSKTSSIESTRSQPEISARSVPEIDGLAFASRWQVMIGRYSVVRNHTTERFAKLRRDRQQKQACLALASPWLPRSTARRRKGT
jgi:hypothetical protein